MKKIALSLAVLFLLSSSFGQQLLWSTVENKETNLRLSDYIGGKKRG